jgi:hypothetical protein
LESGDETANMRPMKAPAQIPKNIRIIDRESFLSTVEKRGHLLLRAQTENPNNHLLVIFADPDDKYAVLVETGPNAEYADLRQASRNAPTGLAVRYIVPCAQCPPYAIPKGLAQTQLPSSLSPLFAPPAGFGEGVEPVEEPAEPEVTEEEVAAPEPAPVPVRTTRSTVPPITPVKPKAVPPESAPVVKPSFAVTTKSVPTLSTVSVSGAAVSGGTAPSGAASASPAPEPATLAALLSRSLQDIEKTLADRDGELRRREDSLREREIALEKDRDLLEEEAGRISSGVENREQALIRREKELHAIAESLVRAMRELDDLRRKIESISSKPFTTGR